MQLKQWAKVATGLYGPGKVVGRRYLCLYCQQNLVGEPMNILIRIAINIALLSAILLDPRCTGG